MMSSTAKIYIRIAEDVPIADEAGVFVATNVELALLELANRTGGLYSCPMTVSVGDWVYKTGVDNQVDRADATTIAPVIGAVIAKPTSTTCIIQSSGRLDGYTGLTTGDRYFIAKGSPGAMTDDPSSIIATSGSVQKLAIAISATEIQIDIKQLIEIQA